MAVAAADFYTYARATGTPLPKTKQEEAKLTPAVNQWKNNQLRRENQGQEGINPGAVAGLTGLAGVGALALAATRGGLRQRVTEAVKPSPGSSVSTGVGGLQQDLGKVTRGRGDTWGEYKESITPKTKVDERDFVQEALDKVEKDAIAQSSIGEYTPQELAALDAEISPKRLSEKRRRERIREGGEKVRQRMVKGLELPEPSWEQTDVVQSREPKAVSPKQVLALPPATSLQETKGSTALSSNDFLQEQGPNKYKYIDPEDVTLSPGGNVPKSETINDQTFNAIDAAEDQQTGRVTQQLQRNEDLDQNIVALGEEQLEAQGVKIDPIDQVAESLPDGAPVIQSEQRVGVATKLTAQELLDQTKGEIIRVEGPQGQVRYAETKSDPLWVGAKSDIPTNTPVPGPDLSQTELSRVLQRQRYEIASNLRKQGKPITSGRIESELQKLYGPKSYDYIRNELRKTNVRDYTKRKHALQLGATYDPKFFDDVDLDSVQIAGEDIPVNPSRRYTEAKTPYTGKAYLDDYSDSLKTPFYSEDTALSLDEAVGKKKNWLKDVQGDITNTMENLESQAKIIKEKQNLARSQGDIAAVNMLEVDLNKLRATYQKQQRRMAGSERSIKESISDLSVPLTVGELPENAGKRVYYETDTTGGRGQKIGKQLPDVDLADEVVDDIDRLRTPMIDPESVELRSEYRIKDTELKGGGGRKMAESGSPRPDNPLDTLVPLQQRGGTLFDRDTNTWKLMADIPENNRGLSRQTTRPVIDAIEPDTGVTDTGGLELAPKIYEDQQGGVTDIYGRRLASDLKDSDTARPTQVVGKVKGPQTQKPTAAMRGKSGTRVVNISENVRHLSDPNWLASQGYNLNKVSPQQLVGEYLQGLQSKTGSPDLQEFLQTRGQSRPLAITNENVDLRGTPVKFKPEAQPSVTQTKVAQPLNYPAAQNQVTYVPPTESTIKSLSVTPSEIEKAERMHLLNYISAAHGQIKGGARAGGTKMRNNLTPYQAPSDAMINQLVMKRRMERI
jgi:hypothetical protein